MENSTMYIFRLGNLPKCDIQVDTATDFTVWLTQWESYCNLFGLSGEDPAKQAKAFMLYFSREMLAFVQNLSLTDKQMKDRRTIIEVTQHYMDGHSNETVKHRNFYWYGTDSVQCCTRKLHALESNPLSTRISSIHLWVWVDALMKYAWRKHLQYTLFLIHKHCAKERDLAKPSQAKHRCTAKVQYCSYVRAYNVNIESGQIKLAKNTY